MNCSKRQRDRFTNSWFCVCFFRSVYMLGLILDQKLLSALLKAIPKRWCIVTRWG